MAFKEVIKAARTHARTFNGPFTLLLLLPCLLRVFFLPLSVLYLLFPNCFSNLLIPQPQTANMKKVLLLVSTLTER